MTSREGRVITVMTVVEEEEVEETYNPQPINTKLAVVINFPSVHHWPLSCSITLLWQEISHSLTDIFIVHLTAETSCTWVVIMFISLDSSWQCPIYTE